MIGGMGSGSTTVRSIATVLTAKDNASDALEKTESAGDDAANSMDSTAESGRNLNRRFVALAGATTALTGAMGTLVAVHGRTEQMFNELGVVAADTDAELEAMRQTALEVGSSMPVSINAATAALRQLSFSGFEAEEAMEAVGGVASLATASTLDVGQAARTSASMLNMFGMEAEEIDRVTASLAATFSNAATNISELAKAVEQAGGTASLLGADLEEVNAVIGTMAGAGIRASAAGTALNSMLTRLVAQSGAAEDAMAELGLELDQFVDDAGEIVNLDIVMGEIVSSLDEMDNRLEQARVASQLFGQRGARAVMSVADEVDNIGKLLQDQYLAQIDDAISKSDEFASSAELIREYRDSTLETSEMAAQLSTHLSLSADAAQLFAQEIADSSQPTDELAEQVNNATTSTELMEAQLNSTRGSIEFLRSSFNALTFNIFQGAGPAIQFFARRVATLTNIAGEHEVANRRLGQALAGVTGIVGSLTAALGANIIASKFVAAASSTMLGKFIAGKAAALGLKGALAAIGSAALPVAVALGILLAPILSLVAIWKTDFLGAGEEAKWVLDQLGAGARWAGSGIASLLGLVGSLVKLFGTVGAAIALAPLAGILNTIGFIRDTDFRQIGRSIPEQIAQGIIGGIPTTTQAMTMLTGAIRARLPGSDAKTGPLSDLTGRGPALVQTLATGIENNSSVLSASLERALAIGGGITESSRQAASSAAGTATSASRGNNYELTVNQEIVVGDADATEDTVRQASRRGASAFEAMMRRLERETRT